MKKILTGSMAAVLALFLSAGLCLAGNGYGSGGQGAGGQGTCGGTGIPIVCTGTLVLIEGDVSDVSYGGSGMEVTRDDGSVVIVYGIGPYRYWDFQGIDRPVVGDRVTVSGMEVDFSGTLRIVAMSITTSQGTVQLREACNDDGTGGQPLWRGGRQNQGQ